LVPAAGNDSLQRTLPPSSHCALETLVKSMEVSIVGTLRRRPIMTSADTFEMIVREHYEPLFRFAMSLTRVEADARDLTQQTFYVWATKGHQLRDLSKAKTWLFTTLNRAFLTGQNRQNRFPHQNVDDNMPELPAPTPEVIDRANSSQVLPALARVDEVYQTAVTLYYLENRSYKDIAVALDVPIGTVKSRIARGIVQLQRLIPRHH
jgi:RNA polymerase sigma-70 factor, ECF subfamily